LLHFVHPLIENLISSILAKVAMYSDGGWIVRIITYNFAVDLDDSLDKNISVICYV